MIPLPIPVESVNNANAQSGTRTTNQLDRPILTNSVDNVNTQQEQEQKISK